MSGRSRVLDTLRDQGPNDEFINVVYRVARKVVKGRRSPSGGTAWQDSDVDDLVSDVLEKKWERFIVAVQEMKSDGELWKWLYSTFTNTLNDRGRATLRGRLTHRVKRIVNDLGDLRRQGSFIVGTGGGCINPNDTEALLRQTHAVETATDWWADPREDPPPGERQDIIALARCITSAANGPVPIDVLVDVIARRLSLPLQWSTSELDIERTVTQATEHQIPPESADAAVRLIAGLSNNERAALPHVAKNPDITSEQLGTAIGKGRSTGATVKKSLLERLCRFTEEDPEGKAAIRYIASEVQAGRFTLFVRSLEGEEGDGDA